jgi:HAE1 family hydrophobic/amphiphilic exporter-1
MFRKPVGVNYILEYDHKVKVSVSCNVSLAGIVLVYLVMVGLYDSFVHPFVVLFSIWLSLVGSAE